MGVPASLPQSYDLHPRPPVLCTHCGRSPFLRTSSSHAEDTCHQCMACVWPSSSMNRLRRERDPFWPEQWVRNIYTGRSGDCSRGLLGAAARDGMREGGKCHHCGHVCNCCPHVEPPPGEEDLVAQEAVERYRRQKEMTLHRMRRDNDSSFMGEDVRRGRGMTGRKDGGKGFYGRITENDRGFRIEVEPESQCARKRRPKRRRERALGRHEFEHDTIGDEEASGMMDEQWQMPSRSRDPNFPREDMRMGMNHLPQATMGMGMGMRHDQSKGGMNIGMNTGRRRMAAHPAFGMNPQHTASRFQDRSRAVHGPYSPADVDEELAEEDPRMAVPYGAYPNMQGGQRAGPEIHNREMRAGPFGMSQLGQQDLGGDAGGYDDGPGDGRMNSFMRDTQGRPGLGGFDDARRRQFERMDGRAKYGVDGMPGTEDDDKGESRSHSSSTMGTASTRSSMLSSQRPTQSPKSNSISRISSRTETKRRCRQDMQPNVEEGDESIIEGMEKSHGARDQPRFVSPIPMPDMPEMPEHGLSADIGSIGDFEDPTDIRD